ncbi:MAG: hypothetical protein AAF357_00285 [Verrucomicrobiota bacterium]
MMADKRQDEPPELKSEIRTNVGPAAYLVESSDDGGKTFAPAGLFGTLEEAVSLGMEFPWDWRIRYCRVEILDQEVSRERINAVCDRVDQINGALAGMVE